MFGREVKARLCAGGRENEISVLKSTHTHKQNEKREAEKKRFVSTSMHQVAENQFFAAGRLHRPQRQQQSFPNYPYYYFAIHESTSSVKEREREEGEEIRSEMWEKSRGRKRGRMKLVARCAARSTTSSHDEDIASHNYERTFNHTQTSSIACSINNNKIHDHT